ncbi:MAG: DUF928 domain-containing protein [Methylococcaceae bacterium]
MIMRVSLLLLLSISFFSSSSYANKKQQPSLQEAKESMPDKKKPKTLSPKPSIKYIPSLPHVESPDTEQHGGARSATVYKTIELLLLAPSHFEQASSQWKRHTGLTFSSQPLLYWYISKLDIEPYRFIEFKLMESGESILTTQLIPLKKAGIQKLDLKKYDVKLKANQRYSWSISLVKAHNRPYDNYADSAFIEYVKTNDIMLKNLKESTASQVSIYAQAGIWHEAISTILQQLENQPDDNSSKQDLVTLMKQVGLEKIVTNY